MPTPNPEPVLLPDWSYRGSCSSLDPELFFPDRGDRVGIQRARKVCAGCSAVGACLDYALANREQFGIWAGTTPAQRNKLLKQLAAQNPESEEKSSAKPTPKRPWYHAELAQAVRRRREQGTVTYDLVARSHGVAL